MKKTHILQSQLKRVSWLNNEAFHATLCGRLLWTRDSRMSAKYTGCEIPSNVYLDTFGCNEIVIAEDPTCGSCKLILQKQKSSLGGHRGTY